MITFVAEFYSSTQYVV